MPWLIDKLLNVAIATFVSGAFWYFKERKKVSHTKELDDHVEKLKYDLGRESINAEHSIKKKHEIYAEMLKLLRHAYGALSFMASEIDGISRPLTYEERNIEDIKSDMEEMQFPSGKIEEIIQLYSTNRTKAIESLKHYIGIIKVNKVQQIVNEANTYWLVNELYITDNITEHIQHIMTNLKQLSQHYHDFMCLQGSSRTRGDQYRQTQELEEEITKLKNDMREDLLVKQYAKN